MNYGIYIDSDHSIIDNNCYFLGINKIIKCLEFNFKLEEDD